MPFATEPDPYFGKVVATSLKFNIGVSNFVSITSFRPALSKSSTGAPNFNPSRVSLAVFSKSNIVSVKLIEALTCIALSIFLVWPVARAAKGTNPLRA